MIFLNEFFLCFFDDIFKRVYFYFFKFRDCKIKKISSYTKMKIIINVELVTYFLWTLYHRPVYLNFVFLA